MTTRCLSLHATYACRHAGACCDAPWAVRAEEHVVRFVEAAGLRRTAAGGELFVRQPRREGAPPELSLAKDSTGRCIFRERRRCTLHETGGEAVLPIGCRHYPRVVRIDTSGVALSLSHYCPTAASLLICADPIQVVAVGPPLALAEPIEGLDARDALPPLLRPEMLMDLPSYAVFEARAVHTFSRLGHAAAGLSAIAAATDQLRGWRPGDTLLQDATDRAFDAVVEPPRESPGWTRAGLPAVRKLNRGLVSVDSPGDLDAAWIAVPGTEHPAVQRVISNYLSARMFANWIAYQGHGLRTVVAWLYACHDVLRVLLCRAEKMTIADVLEAIRQTDYVMLHTIDSDEFARALSGIEG